MNRQDLVYLHHTLKNANIELKNIRRKFDREKNKILKKSRKGANKTRKKKRHYNIIFFLFIKDDKVGVI